MQMSTIKKSLECNIERAFGQLILSLFAVENDPKPRGNTVPRSRLAARR
jgi:hypothetical protein